MGGVVVAVACLIVSLCFRAMGWGRQWFPWLASPLLCIDFAWYDMLTKSDGALDLVANHQCRSMLSLLSWGLVSMSRVHLHFIR